MRRAVELHSDRVRRAARDRPQLLSREGLRLPGLPHEPARWAPRHRALSQAIRHARDRASGWNASHIAQRKSEDIFHARLAASPDGRWLLDNGWVWHPLAIVAVYDVVRALQEPEHLSSSGIAPELGDAFDGDVAAATFSGDRLVVCGGDDRQILSIIELPSGRNLATVPLSEGLGTRLMAWDDDHVIALDDQPRLVALADGKIVHRWDDVGPASRPCPTLALESPHPPHVAVDPSRPRFALADDHRVVVISAEDP